MKTSEKIKNKNEKTGEKATKIEKTSWRKQRGYEFAIHHLDGHITNVSPENLRIVDIRENRR